jgi:predicted O-linked N-acetylglucosamine transferase (SPINDLY family)
LTESEAVRLAFDAVQRRDLSEAERLCKEVLTTNPDSIDALYLFGYIAIETRRMQLAGQILSRAAALAPANPEIQNNRGLAFAGLKRYEEALSCYDRAIELKPDFPDAFNNRGNALMDTGRDIEALASYDRALSIRHTASVVCNRGNVLRKLRRWPQALADYDASLALSPDHVNAHFGRGNVLRDLGRHAEAVESYLKVIALAPDYAEAHHNLGSTLRELRQHDRALEHFRHAIGLRPEMADTYNNLGLTLHEMARDAEAIAMYDRALSLKHDAGTYLNRGNVFRDRGLLVEALDNYGKALELEPELDFLYGAWLHTKLKLCDWEGLDQQRARLTERILQGAKVTLPFSVLAITDDPAIQRKAAETWVRHKYPAAQFQAHPAPRSDHDKIRIGYFSADFYEHATSRLMAELFERHDRSRFRLFAFSFGPDTVDAMRTRVAAAFDEFFDVGNLSDHEVAKLARHRQIDIAVDLKGFTKGNRAGIFALRAAPVQVSYLAYPGTMGADFIDYLMADRILIPAAAERHYSESIIFLPDSYQVNDRQRQIADREFRREDVGLPATGFVYCCFNSNYKILPETFDSWMQILGRVDRSVLWLLRDDTIAELNLKTEAARRGIDPNRLVFAQHLPMSEHLARHRLADLFLDTHPYNAHTTASDALWAGLPIVTRAGKCFASRVAASLLDALGLRSLVVDSMEAYVQLAVRLAVDDSHLRSIRQALSGNRLQTPLFDCETMGRHIEAAYETIHQRWLNNEPPRSFNVPR